MYSPMEIEGVDYELKPMNCPFHLSVYKSSLLWLLQFTDTIC